MTSPDLHLVGSYEYRLVVLSVLIAMLGSYSTIELGVQVTASRGRARLSWLIGGVAVMGIGTWSMHFTGMLALRLPVPVQYDWPTVLFSFLAGVFSSAVALFVVSRLKMGSLRALIGSIFMGGGIVALHYIAMSSMRLPAMCHYSAALVTLSVVFAMVFSLTSLWLTFLFRDDARRTFRKTASALLLGAAISVMHYTGMASASFTRSAVVPDLSRAVNISSLDAAVIGRIAVMVLVVALLTSLLNRLQKQRALLDSLFEQEPQAIALTDKDNRIVRVNREFTRLFGYTPQETVGRNVGELIVPHESRAEEQRYTDLVAQGQRVDAEGIRQREDGSRLHVSIVRVPVSVPGGLIAVYAIYHDITERKRAAEALRTKSQQLRALSARLSSAREEEGTRIARELHDELGSALTSLKWDLEGIEKLCSESGNQADSSKVREKIKGVLGLIDATINTVIRISTELRPSILDDLGLVAVIEWQAQQFEARTGIICRFDSFLDDPDLSREQTTAIFRILQEALTNILRHSQATRVNIMMEEEDGEFVLEVKDNGRGITEAERVEPRALGLIGMRERAHLAGGRIEITGVAGKGTVLTLRVPINGHAAD